MRQSSSRKSKKKRQPGQLFCGMIAILAAVLLCVIVVFYAAVYLDYDFGGLLGAKSAGDTPTTAAEGEVTLTPDEPTPISELLTPTFTVELPPTPTPTLEPPSYAYDARVWSLVTQSLFADESLLRGSWMYISEWWEWEMEYLPYESLDALYLMFEGEATMVHPGVGVERYDLADTEMEVVLALPESDGMVSIFCRQQPDSEDRYALNLTWQNWTITKTASGIEFILAQGEWPDGGFEGWNLYRFRCEGNKISAYDFGGLLAEVEDSDLSIGATGFSFYVDDGKIGQVYLYSERVTTLLGEGEAASLYDSVEVGNLMITFTSSWKSLGPLTEADYEGLNLISLEVMFENRDPVPIELRTDQITLQQGGMIYSALDFIPTGFDFLEEDVLILPDTVHTGASTWGLVFFAGLDEEDMLMGWQLVIDLSEYGYQPVKFNLPTE